MKQFGPRLVMRGAISVILLIVSNAFMTFAWYGHLKFKDDSWLNRFGLPGIVLISWGIALFEYILQVPANRIGFKEYGGPFSLVQLKVIQEVITLLVFSIFSIVYLGEKMKWNYLVGFGLILLAVFFVFRKW